MDQNSENSRRLWLSEIPCWKSFQANFDAAGKFLTDFPAARNAIPAKVWALSGKENGCWKMGRACGNAAGLLVSLLLNTTLRAQRLKKKSRFLGIENFK